MVEIPFCKKEQTKNHPDAFNCIGKESYLAFIRNLCLLFIIYLQNQRQTQAITTHRLSC